MHAVPRRATLHASLPARPARKAFPSREGTAPRGREAGRRHRGRRRSRARRASAPRRASRGAWCRCCSCSTSCRRSCPGPSRSLRR
eukprot:8971645-Lingulodinium_polyedra.AAC.1